MSVAQVERIFKIGATEIPDPLPGFKLEDSVRQLARQFPQFRHTKIWEEDGVINAKGQLEYVLHLPQPKVKG